MRKVTYEVEGEVELKRIVKELERLKSGGKEKDKVGWHLWIEQPYV